jgi:CMP/dCMP kinase
MTKRLVIAIDGPVGSGKSTVARSVAHQLGYTYVDTGAMYRALALKALRAGIALDASEELAALAERTQIEVRTVDGKRRTFLDGVDVSAAIRTAPVAQAASQIAVVPAVRRVLVAAQQRAGDDGGVVIEGRDIGSVVFPGAELKIYLTASVPVRAERRWRDHQRKGEAIRLPQLEQEVRERDRRDSERATSPLVRAPDAVLIDSTAMEVNEVVRLIAMLARERENSAASASVPPA